MHPEEIKANEKRFFDFVNRRDTEAVEKWIDECVAEDFVNHSTAFDEKNDREGLKEMFRKLIQFVPDRYVPHCTNTMSQICRRSAG